MRRAADDFPAIRARMEELRRDRRRASAPDEAQAIPAPVAAGEPQIERQFLAPHMRRLIERQRLRAWRQLGRRGQ